MCTLAVSFVSHKMAFYWYITVLVIVFYDCLKGVVLPELPQRMTVCRGDILRPSCSAGQKMAIQDVHYGTKLATTCAESDTSAGCCDYDAADCLLAYTGASQQASCAGKDLCTDLTVAQADTSSCGGDYPGLNHYLTMEYYCIPAERVSSMCSLVSVTSTGFPFYLYNTDYPSPVRSTENSCLCSVEAESCTSNINVYLVHFQLDDGAGACTDTQVLEINDTTGTQTLTCSDNTNYTITAQTTSTANYMTLSFSNPSGTNAGYFWIGFEATETTAPLKISCPADAKTTCNDCPSLTDPNQGIVSFSNGLSYASVATYSCSSGYKVAGNTTRTCLVDGSWDGAEPTCEAIADCGNPSTVGYTYGAPTPDTNEGATVTVTCATGYEGTATPTPVTCQATGFWETVTGCSIKSCPIPTTTTGYTAPSYTALTYESTASVSCDSGYTGSPADIVCQADQTWSTPTGCEVVDCGTLGSPASGSVAYSTGTAYQSVATFSCSTGYTLTGVATRTCQSDGSWSGTGNPTCDIFDCGAVVANGQITGDTIYGSNATLSCDSGYNSNTLMILCTETGWSPSPSCDPKDCGSLPDPPNGVANSTAGTTYLSAATFSCNVGYTLTGSDSSTCQSDGSWSNTDPQCQIVDCGLLADPSDGSADTTAGTTYLSVATFTCNTGYTEQGSITSTCQADGQWSNTDPQCLINDCGPLADPLNGVANTSAGTTYMSVATFTCDVGYTVMTLSTSTCQADETWDNTDPQCTINDCGNLPSPSNGAVTFPGATTYGDIAQYSCDPGYNLVGVATRTCQADSSWSDNDPTCEIKDCGPVTPPANGAVVYSNNGATTYQETATFTCNAGYNLVGDTTRTCDVTGTWGGATPVCNVKDCGVLTNPLNGVVTTSSGTTYGQTAVYTCNPGYGLSGNSQRQCQADGTWDGTAPVCILADCPNLASPTHGTVSIDSTNFNGIANYTCDAGYILIGNQIRTCQSEGTWTGTAPSCQILDCGNPPYVLNAAYATPTGTLFGATAVYTCTTGFGPVGSTLVQCLATAQWDTLPVCIEDCGPPIDIENGVYVEPDNTLVDAEVTYSCNSGYAIVGKATIICQDVGTWTSAPGCQIIPVAFNESCLISDQCETDRATCRSDGLGDTKCKCAASGEVYDLKVDSCLADCGLLSDPSNGMVTNPELTSEGQIASYTCNVGYALNDVSKAIRTCLSTGVWSPAAPLCVVGCPDPLPPVHGHVDVSNGRAAGDTITYSCESGYHLIGQVSRECRDDTTWSGNDPVCYIECPILSGVADGHVDLSAGYWEGSIATYICDKDYALVGTSTRTCQNTGQWNGIEPTCVFAIFPDVLLVVAGLLIFIVIVDVLVVAFCVYIRYEKKKQQSLNKNDNDFDDFAEPTDEEKYPIPEYDEKAHDKLENGTLPNLMMSGHTRASLKKQRNSKVAPEDANKKTPQMPRKPPVPKQEKSLLKGGIPKPKPLAKGAYKNTTPFGPKVYGPDPIRFKNETIPFVPLETSEPPPNTLQQPIADEVKEEKVADVEKLLKEGGFTSETNDKKKNKQAADDDNISIDHLTNPVFDMDDKMILMDYDAHGNRKPIIKLDDTQEAFKGRVQLPKNPEKSSGLESEGEQHYMSEEARRHLKTTMSAYSPTIGNALKMSKT